MKTDIQIAQEATMKDIRVIAEKIGATEDDIEMYGKSMAKLSDEFIEKLESKENGKLVLVTAINPTPAGEGKTTVTLGLGDALKRLGTYRLSWCYQCRMRRQRVTPIVY